MSKSRCKSGGNKAAVDDPVCEAQIKAAIIALKAKDGSSLSAIIKAVKEKNEDMAEETIKTTVKALTKRQVLSLHKNFYKLSKDTVIHELALANQPTDPQPAKTKKEPKTKAPLKKKKSKPMRKAKVEKEPEEEVKKMKSIKKYARCPRPECKGEELKKRATELVSANKAKYDTKEHYIKMLSLVDYTTLDICDTTEKVSKMVTCVNDFPAKYPEAKNVAAICVYPPFASLVKTGLKDSLVKVACVSAGFPASQATLHTKLVETEEAVKNGADEIDIVLPVGKYMEKKYEEISEEISQLKQVCGDKELKVILEIDALKDYQLIADASFLAMEAGADFIKTSTGKYERDVSAFESRFLVMCEAIHSFNAIHGTHIGIKPAGGVRTPEQALSLYTIVSEILGTEYQSNTRFRIGASALANALLSKIMGKEEKYFT